MIVGNDRGRCTLPTHVREKGLFIYKPGKQNAGIVEKFMWKSTVFPCKKGCEQKLGPRAKGSI